MKKLIPFLVSGILLVGTIGCQEATKTGSETQTGAPAKEASQTTGDAMKGDAMKGDAMKGDAMKGDAMKGGADTKSLVNSKLTEKIPGSKLAAEDKDGVVTVTGTVPSEADIKKIEPAVKEVKGVKSVKVEATVGTAKP
ncbi:BON domain-containing protein [Scytonema hofmannii FACHB-248]|uniref:BON domain-containing protein n=1 Tax=Scytonema hofmannii FACHB-248 TaxID=1842502 RepID=A0ABR8GSL3_9CYAN|nr:MULTISPECIES: BON domain-containing protein [Nostocales]MBD2606113.1 BON domain-containing protein [Scytonema hofmannii FACHB-248]